MDSTFDKLGEILVFIGCIAAVGNSNVGTVPILVAAGAMGASIMVSYTRAKSDALGYSSGHGPGRGRHHAPRDPPRDHLARHRPHRDEHRHLGLEFALGIILVGAVITVIQRILTSAARPSRPTTPRSPRPPTNTE
jgi:hypothetical protein